MKKIFKEFLEGNLELSNNDEKFDFNFNENSSLAEFNAEFQKMLTLESGVFYYKNRLVTVINSLEIRLKPEVIEHLLKLYIYAENNNLIIERELIVEFLYTYHKTIYSDDYRENSKDYKVTRLEFNNLLKKYNMSKKFYEQFKDNCYSLYKKILNYGIENDVFIDGETISRIFNNLAVYKDYYNELLDLLVRNRKCIHNLVAFDKEKEKHKSIYYEYIIDSFSDIFGYNYVKEIIKELDAENIIDDKELKEIVNNYINITNTLCDKCQQKEGSFIQNIAQIDELKNGINYLINNIKNFNSVEKEKLHECLKHLLKVKRIIIADDDYQKSEMKEFKYEEKIPKEETDKINDELLENSLKIYSALKIDFFKQLELALENYSKYPLSSLGRSFNIDSKSLIYNIGIDTKNKDDNNFKNIFDKSGKKYTDDHKKLMNKKYDNYYEELLKSLDFVFMTRLYLLISILGKDNINIVLNNLKNSLGYIIENDYSILCANIMAIESLIVDILKSHNITISKDGFTNLNNLAKTYENETDIVNGLMYINYTLYENNGLNIRNKAFHGTLINSDLTIPLLTTYSCLIFMSWMKNGRK